MKSKNHHALDSFIYEYVNAGGVRDDLKIEINYMLRCHVLPVTRRKVRFQHRKSRQICITYFEKENDLI